MSRNLVLKGNLIKGLGEGSYYMKKQSYKKQFQNLLNYTPWPGTLNIKLKSSVTKKISNLKPIIIKGFKEKNRSFGKIKCYPCSILNIKKDIKTHLIVPERTSHSNDIIEIIAPVYLKKHLNIKEGDGIIIQLDEK